jgi:hypothetical protein
MDKVEELLRKRRWAPDCLRVNIAQPDQIITRGTTGKVKIAKVRSNLLRKNEHELREAIRVIAPEWWDDETQVILNHNVQCKRHRDSSNKEHSWIIFLGDFTGGALCFDDGVRIDEQYRWHKINGHVYHWNEPHEGEKFSIVLYRNGSKKTKIQQIQDAQKRKKKAVTEEPNRGIPALKEAVSGFLDVVAEIVKSDGDAELRELVAKILAPVRETIDSIPAPAG